MTNPTIEVFRNPAATPAIERSRLLENPGFGRVFTDHMATAIWCKADGWHSLKVAAREPFTLDPAAGVLHYAQEIFEGMKAYRGQSGTINLFRAEQNARRFNASWPSQSTA